MKEYAYYPGCSLEHTAAPYDRSVREIFRALDINLKEIDDWNCCGATMYMSTKKTVGYAISARNLALAQKTGLDICAPCSSCYTILRKTNRQIAWDPKERAKINEALAAGGLTYDGNINVRHPLDILVNDIGLDTIKTKVKKPLTGLKIAPYYGCQIVRPYGYFDDVDDPVTMDRLIEALGAEATYFPGKVRCCGGMLMLTDESVAMKLCLNLLQAAVDNEADMIATACPLCQINLEAYQNRINSKFGQKIHIPIVCFTQIVGIALGLSPASVGLDKLMIRPDKLMNIREVTPV